MSTGGGWGAPPGGGSSGGGGGWGPPPGGGGGGWGSPPGGPPPGGGSGGGGWGAPPGGGGPGGFGGPPGQPGGFGAPPGQPGGGWGPQGSFGDQAPPPGMPPGYRPDGGAMPLAGGVPWESPHGGLFGRWWETMTAANFKGRELFAAVGQNDDAMSACLFSMTTGALVGAVIGLLYLIVLAIWSTAMLAILGSVGISKVGGAVAGMGIGIGLLIWIGMVVVYAVGGFIGPWVVGGLHHLVLMMVSGVGQGKEYSHSVRVNAYANSASMLFIPIPFLGGLVALVFNIINHVTGYDQVHRCGGGKAFLAWVSPVLICCCCYFMLFMMAAMLG